MGAIVNGRDGTADIEDEDLGDAVRPLSHHGGAVLLVPVDRPLELAGWSRWATRSAAVVGLVA